MAVVEEKRITLPDLRRVVRETDPRARLLPSRVLRRIIKHHAEVGGLGLRVPHRKSYVVSVAEALEVADADELGLDPGLDPGSWLILLAEPDPDALSAMSADEALLLAWRLLFHANVDLAIETRYRDGSLTLGDVRSRIKRLGTELFDEAATVLGNEDFLVPPRDERVAYRELAAVFLEQTYFVPGLRPIYFPAATDPGTVESLLAADCDAERLFESTRPDGAPDPALMVETALLIGVVETDDEPGEVIADEPVDDDRPPGVAPSEGRLLVRRAQEAATAGNAARAAIAYARAALGSPAPREAHRLRQLARAELDRLANRLRAAMGIGTVDAESLARALPALLERATSRGWPAESRLLFDLQNVCVDHERPIYRVDLVEWALSLGKRPVQRSLPFQKEVLTCKHLRTALRRLRRARIDHRVRDRLADLLGRLLHRAEHQLRDRCRGPVSEALATNGLAPRTIPERVAFAKLVEELLDRIVRRGFLTMGDLRDGIARNDLKLPDLSGPMGFLRGDQLLRTDDRLSIVLDGIYHGGESYLRLLQRLSSLAFGIAFCRFLIQYVVLPFGGAFVIVKGLDHLVADAGRLIFGAEPPPAHHEPHVADLPAAHHGHDAHTIDPAHFPYVVFAAGLLLFGLIHMPAFRSVMAHVLHAIWRGIHGVIFDLPTWILSRPIVVRLLVSRPFLVIWRGLIKPLMPAILCWSALQLLGLQTRQSIVTAVCVFVGLAVFLNTRMGRDTEEIALDHVVATWRRIRVDIVPGLIRLVLDVFRGFLETIDRVLYTVDEWLRFRGGESRVSFVLKAALGVVWFAVTYVVRFAVNLLVEPQLNPIKHFPVVTVSHKVLAPLLLAMIPLLTPTLGKERATTIWFFTQLLLPGVFGFLIWELKENWKLYEANRPERLRPVPIGHHGETMLRLLRPGFHSGTVPKLYAKYRRAARRLLYRAGLGRPGNGPDAPADDRMRRLLTGRLPVVVRRQRDELHHVAEAVAAFLDRELLELLRLSRSWAHVDVAVGHVTLATNRIRAELSASQLGPEPVVLEFFERSGRVLGSVVNRGWLDHLSPARRATFGAALAGLYQKACVTLTGEQVADVLGRQAATAHLGDLGLIVWPDPAMENETVYRLDDELESITPRTADPESAEIPIPLFPAIPAQRLLLSKRPITWSRWVATWEAEQRGQSPPDPFLDGYRMLPG